MDAISFRSAQTRPLVETWVAKIEAKIAPYIDDPDRRVYTTAYDVPNELLPAIKARLEADHFTVKTQVGNEAYTTGGNVTVWW
jgi:hypothetical protein